MHRLFAAAAAAVLVSTASAQFTVVVPNGTATTEGNSSNAFPWGRGGTGLIISNLYDGSNFTAQGINFPILVNRLRWRIDSAIARTWVNSSYGQASIALSTSPLDQGAVTAGAPLANFDGADKTTVFSGPVSWLAGSTTPPGPGAWTIDVPLTTNFLYDPALGDLNIQTDLPVQTFTGTAVQLDVQTTGSLSSRIYISTGYPTGATAVTLNHGVVVEVGYVPAAGLYAGFNANVTGGPSPLAVNFTDASYTSAPGGITGWAWDFNGDSVIDSTAQNPSHIYTNCGTYDVSLTVTDGVNPPNTRTRTAYIRSDVLQANFTTQVIAPLTVQFTDTSNMPATSWAWDLNGDSVIDSNAQNPVWVYPNGTPVTATMTASRLCGPASTVSRLVAPTQEITTLYAGGNGGASLWTVYYDVNVTNPLGVRLAGLGVNSSTAAATPFTLDFYVKSGTYVGFTSTPAAWRLAGTASGTTAGVGQPSVATLAAPIYLPAGTYGVAIRYNGATPTYTNGTGSNQNYLNGDLELNLGAAQATTTAAFTGGTPFAPRVWNGTLFYETNNITGAAGYGFFGEGCPGTLGIVEVQNSNQPTIGGTLSTTVTNLQTGIALMILGTSNTLSGAIPLPLDLGFLGATGCSLRVSLDVTATVVGAPPSAPWSFTIPNVPTLLGFLLYNQAASLDPINSFGFVLSDAYGWVLGN
jgi:PKD repeat protein